MGVIYVPPGGHVYSLTYWSRGQRAQGYLTVPAGPKPHALFIYLHGGYYIAEPGHTDDDYWTRQEAIVNAQARAVAFLPNYVGYGPSGGKVGDAYQDTQDVANGLKALARIRGLRLERNATYLLGFSLGGAIGVLLAEHDPQVHAAALDSPWPGARMSLSWYQTNYFHLNRDERLGYKILTRYEGSNTASRWYRRNSYDCQDVHSLKEGLSLEALRKIVAGQQIAESVMGQVKPYPIVRPVVTAGMVTFEREQIVEAGE